MDPVVVTAASKNNSDENNSGKNSAKNAVPKINIVSMAKANDKNTLKTSNGQTEVRFFFLKDFRLIGTGKYFSEALILASTNP